MSKTRFGFPKPGTLITFVQGDRELPAEFVAPANPEDLRACTLRYPGPAGDDGEGRKLLATAVPHESRALETDTSYWR
ncbi:MAG TPA: hypothetical protein VFU47_03835 [Armatimonadota bacterium]|nr:hypothetical protein [Armatimonadota bacterium]